MEYIGSTVYLKLSLVLSDVGSGGHSAYAIRKW